MAGTCKRRFAIEQQPGAAAGVEVFIPLSTTEYALQAVDSAGAGVAWELRTAKAGPGFHFAAGASWTEDDLTLDQDLKLWVLSAAGSTVEVARWEG